MRLNFFILLISITVICNIVLGHKTHHILILPGLGIVYEKDSIMLDKTTYNEVCKILKIRDRSKFDEISVNHWEGYDQETGEPTSGSEYVKEIKYKSIMFEFAHDKYNGTEELRSIRLKADKSLMIITDSGLIMGMINPQIKYIYPRTENNYNISEEDLTYDLFSYGVSFKLEKLANNDLKLIEISTLLIK